MLKKGSILSTIMYKYIKHSLESQRQVYSSLNTSVHELVVAVDLFVFCWLDITTGFTHRSESCGITLVWSSLIDMMLCLCLFAELQCGFGYLSASIFFKFERMGHFFLYCVRLGCDKLLWE